MKTTTELKALTDSEKHVLRSLALLGDITVDRGKFATWIGDGYDDAIDTLADNGWLRVKRGTIPPKISLGADVAGLVRGTLKPNAENCAWVASLCEGIIDELIYPGGGQVVKEGRSAPLRKLLLNISENLDYTNAKSCELGIDIIDPFYMEASLVDFTDDRAVGVFLARIMDSPCFPDICDWSKYTAYSLSIINLTRLLRAGNGYIALCGEDEFEEIVGRLMRDALEAERALDSAAKQDAENGEPPIDVAEKVFMEVYSPLLNGICICKESYLSVFSDLPPNADFDANTNKAKLIAANLSPANFRNKGKMAQFMKLCGFVAAFLERAGIGEGNRYHDRVRLFLSVSRQGFTEPRLAKLLFEELSDDIDEDVEESTNRYIYDILYPPEDGQPAPTFDGFNTRLREAKRIKDAFDESFANGLGFIESSGGRGEVDRFADACVRLVDNQEFSVLGKAAFFVQTAEQLLGLDPFYEDDDPIDIGTARVKKAALCLRFLKVWAERDEFSENSGHNAVRYIVRCRSEPLKTIEYSLEYLQHEWWNLVIGKTDNVARLLDALVALGHVAAYITLMGRGMLMTELGTEKIDKTSARCTYGLYVSAAFFAERMDNHAKARELNAKRPAGVRAAIALLERELRNVKPNTEEAYMLCSDIAWLAGKIGDRKIVEHYEKRKHEALGLGFDYGC